LFREAYIKDPPDRNIINIYSTCLLFREANIDDLPDSSVYEHYQHIYIAQVCCSERLTLRTHPTAASMNIKEVSSSERLTSRSHQIAASMNIIKASGFKK
jgi:hypothetical protein